MHVGYPMEFILRSNAEWCNARYELETEQPLGEKYRLHCPSCKQKHAFTVTTRHD